MLVSTEEDMDIGIGIMVDVFEAMHVPAPIAVVQAVALVLAREVVEQAAQEKISMEQM